MRAVVLVTLTPEVEEWCDQRGTVWSAVARRVENDASECADKGASAKQRDTVRAADAWDKRFGENNATQCAAAAALVPSQPAGALQEGPSWRITVGPGAVKVSTVDEAKAERTAERAEQAGHAMADIEATYLAEVERGDREDLPEPATRREITEWSRKSRNRMTYTLAMLDYEPMFADGRLPAAVTLTYPGCWVPAVPTGKAAKGHLDKLRKRYERAYGEPLRCIWKLEFQGRPGRCGCDVCGEADDGRVPHFHLLMSPPRNLVDELPFHRWLSKTWAEIVAHPDPEQYTRHLAAGTRVDWNEGLRCTDPKRVAVYFTKHGTFAAKEYQHRVPAHWQQPDAGPGRFWGYWGLDKVEVEVPVSPQNGTRAGRVLRKLSQAAGHTEVDPYASPQERERRVKVTHARTRPHYPDGQRPLSRYADVIGLAGAQLMAAYAPDRYQTVRVPAVRCRDGRGWLSVNNGAKTAEQLARWLHVGRDQRDSDWLAAEQRRLGVRPHPVYRAQRLQPGPRRDALIARLQVKAY